MQLKPLSPNFLIRVPKKEERDRSEKEGEIYLHPSFVWMTRNTQCGFIHSISKGASRNMPEANIGDVLIVHHFTQGSLSTTETTKRYLVYEDDDNNYYNVTSTEHNGTNNQSYGLWNGSVIVPHRDYVFLEKDTDDDAWHQSDEEVQDKIQCIKDEIMSLTRTKITPEIIRAVERKEREQLMLGKKMHSAKYLIYKIAYANKSLGIAAGSEVFVKSNAVNTTIEFHGKEYRVCDKRYIGAY